MVDLGKQTARAMKWSSITELLSKIISPVINMILARILAPEAFGILATVTMIISFAEIFVETGFQKYLVQHQFEDKNEENRYMSVALWANLLFSAAILALILIFRDPLAFLVGDPDKGHVIAVASLVIPLYSLVGVQDCRLKKNLEFKKLFYVRVASSLTPLISTIPLALLGFGFWSLIIGNIAGVLVRVIFLALFGGFKPQLYFNFGILRAMLQYGMWTMLDGVALWATNWIDSLLISHLMSDYYLGLYRNSISTVTSLFAMVTAAVTPVLFASLSRLQDDTDGFNRMFLKVQRSLCIFLLPIGAGLMLYRGLATTILFGEQWVEATNIIGIFALTTVLRTIFISFYGDAYRAKGHFRIPFVIQCLELLVLIPACIVAAKSGFWTLVYTRALLKLDVVLLEAFVVWKICKITPIMTIKAILPTCVATLAMCAFGLTLQMISSSVIWQLISVVLCAIVYFVVLLLFPQERILLKNIMRRRNKKNDNRQVKEKN